MPSTRTHLPYELVPLTEATAAVYQAFNEGPVGRPPRIDEVRRQLAMALAALAPIYLDDGVHKRPLSVAEVESTVAGGKAPGAPDLSGLFIRRLDLVRAVEQLKASRSN
jgi:hypothetical protein